MACDVKHIVPFLLITAPMFILELLAFLWIRKLKTSHNSECVCASNWRLNFLYGYLAFILVWTVALNGYRFSIGCEIPTRSLIKSPVYLSFIGLLLIASVSFLVISLQYLSLLKKKQCQCALKTMGDEILQAVVYIKIIAFALLALLVFMLIFALTRLSK